MNEPPAAARAQIARAVRTKNVSREESPPMAKKAREPKVVRPADIDPHHDWGRPLMALGQMAVDFEERVDFRRLHSYRLARTRTALAGSGLGAILTFDQHNIRYISSTVIG